MKIIEKSGIINMVYSDLNFKKNFNFDEGAIILLKDGHYQVMGPVMQPAPQLDKIVLLRIKAVHDSKQLLDTYLQSDVVTMTKLELIAQLLDIPQTELLEILYA